MATKRKGISKKTRFEVFKRDGFKCQYCGQSAPDVVLHVDHINPVCKGGTNDIINLVTSCVNCNLGKGGNELSDTSVAKKRMKQAQDNNDRIEQIKMLADWHLSQATIIDAEVEAVYSYVVKLTGYGFNDNGRIKIEKAIKKNGLNNVLNAVKDSYEKYDVDKFWEDFFDGIIRFSNMKKLEESKPYITDIFYIRGILTNRFRYDNIDRKQLVTLIETAHTELGLSLEYIKEEAKTTQSKADFYSFIVGEDYE